MIITVTLNPAIDKTVYVNSVKLGEVNKVKMSMIDPGGKGINVSKVLRNLDNSAVCMGFLGGKNGQLIKERLKDIKIPEMFTTVACNTRMNIKIIDGVTGVTTDLNERGEEIYIEELEDFIYQFKEKVKENDLVVLSGSAPIGVPDHIYRILSDYVNQVGAKVFLDTSGNLLKEALKSELYLIKPNKEELAEALGKKLESEEEIIMECQRLLTGHVKYICLSMGVGGAMLVGENFILKATVPKVIVKSTVGAGDSLLGALVSFLDNGYSIEEAFTMGVSASVVAVTKEGTKAPNLDEINSMAEKIKVVQEEIN